MLEDSLQGLGVSQAQRYFNNIGRARVYLPTSMAARRRPRGQGYESGLSEERGNSGRRSGGWGGGGEG